MPFKVRRFQLVIDVQLVWICRPLWSPQISCTFDINLKDEGVAVRGLVLGTSYLHQDRVYVEWNKPNSLGQHFIMDKACVIPCEDILYANCWKLLSRLSFSPLDIETTVVPQQA